MLLMTHAHACPILFAAHERVGVLSNRAAAHLVLGRYPEAEADCGLALAAALPGLSGACEAAAAAFEATAGPTKGSAAASEEADNALHAWVAGPGPSQCLSEASDSSSTQASEPAPTSAPEGTAVGTAAPTGRARLLSVARLLARRGVVRGHMRRYDEAACDCRSASSLYRQLGEEGKAVQLEEDAARLEGLGQGGSRQQGSVSVSTADDSCGASAASGQPSPTTVLPPAQDALQGGVQGKGGVQVVAEQVVEDPAFADDDVDD